jgi:hypothetical protein
MTLALFILVVLGCGMKRCYSGTLTPIHRGEVRPCDLAATVVARAYRFRAGAVLLERTVPAFFVERVWRSAWLPAAASSRFKITARARCAADVIGSASCWPSSHGETGRGG